MIRIYALINIYKHIGKKHGEDIIKIVRLNEKLKRKYVKLKAGSIKCCKREAIILTFAKVNLSIKSGGCKLKNEIAKLVMDTELADKHHDMRKLCKQIRDVIIELKSSLSLELFHTVIHQVGIAVKSKIKCIKSRHEKKLDKFRQRQLKLHRNDSRYSITFDHTYFQVMKS